MFPGDAKRVILIRSGGLGDFVLTLPLLRAVSRLAETCLVTKRRYWALIERDRLAHRFLDIDSALFSQMFFSVHGAAAAMGLLDGAAIISFLPDDDHAMRGRGESCGAVSFTTLESRPAARPHVAERMFMDCALPLPRGFPRLSVLAREGPGGSRLWLHPGSGSRRKNAPLAFFVNAAREWLAAGRGEVTVSFGEADLALYEAAADRFPADGCELLVLPALPELRRRLTREVAVYLGNDTGVTHLAAAVGVPCKVVFRVTDPDIWRPLGRDVTILRQSPGA